MIELRDQVGEEDLVASYLDFLGVGLVVPYSSLLVADDGGAGGGDLVAAEQTQQTLELVRAPVVLKLGVKAL